MLILNETVEISAASTGDYLDINAGHTIMDNPLL
jgi:hypothetical protein